MYPILFSFLHLRAPSLVRLASSSTSRCIQTPAPAMAGAGKKEPGTLKKKDNLLVAEE